MAILCPHDSNTEQFSPFRSTTWDGCSIEVNLGWDRSSNCAPVLWKVGCGSLLAENRMGQAPGGEFEPLTIKHHRDLTNRSWIVASVSLLVLMLAQHSALWELVAVIALPRVQPDHSTASLVTNASATPQPALREPASLTAFCFLPFLIVNVSYQSLKA